MDKELIERLAKKAGYDVDDGVIASPTSQSSGNDAGVLAKFAALVAEECITELGWHYEPLDAIKAIRAIFAPRPD